MKIAVETEETRRERRMQKLAAKLLFEVQKQGDRFTLVRNIDVTRPIEHENLTVEEAEKVLNSWKLRGLHGG